MPNYRVLISLLLVTLLTKIYAQENEVLFVQQKYDELIQKCTPPQGESDYYWLALSLDKQGNSLKAIKYLEALNDSNLLPQTSLLKADLYYKTGQYKSAKPIFKANSKSNNSFLKLMRIYEFNADYITAVDSIKLRLDSDSTNIELLSILANCYYRLDATVLATQTYEKIYTQNPNDLSTANKLSILLLNSRKEGNIRRAIEIADSVLSHNADNKRFLRTKGRGHYILNDYHRALPCFKSLYTHGYNNLSNCKHLGICEYKTGAYDSARIHLLEAYIIEPTDIQTNLFVGKSFLETGQIFGALIYLKNVDTLLLPTDEMMTSLLWEKQRCYRELEAYGKVDTLLHQLIQHDSKSDYYFYIASNYENGLEDKAKALLYYEKFMTASSTPEEIKKTKSLREIAQGRIDLLKEDEFWNEE